MPPWAMDPRYMHHSRAGSGKFLEFFTICSVNRFLELTNQTVSFGSRFADVKFNTCVCGP